MTKKTTATATATAPKLAKVKADTLVALADAFIAHERAGAEAANAQRLDVIAMSQVGAFDACWPVLETRLASAWTAATLKVSKSFLKRYWTATESGIAFPEPAAGMAGWLRYSREGELAEALRDAGKIATRSPAGATGKAGGKAAADAKAEAKTVAKGADTLPDVLDAMAELANRAAIMFGDKRAALAIIANLRDDIDALQSLAK